MKNCRKCNKNKPLAEFRRNKKYSDGYATICKDCIKKYDKDWYNNNPQRRNKIQKINTKQIDKNKHLVIEYLKSHSCIDCGEEDIIVLDFDHRLDKKQTISFMTNSAYSTEAIIKEIAKCDVRCANCHRRKTAKEFGWFKAGVA